MSVNLDCFSKVELANMRSSSLSEADINATAINKHIKAFLRNCGLKCYGESCAIIGDAFVACVDFQVSKESTV